MGGKSVKFHHPSEVILNILAILFGSWRLFIWWYDILWAVSLDWNITRTLIFQWQKKCFLLNFRNSEADGVRATVSLLICTICKCGYLPKESKQGSHSPVVSSIYQTSLWLDWLLNRLFRGNIRRVNLI